MSPILGALADDLTGGLELAAMLQAGGASCAFVTDPEAIPHTTGDAIVVALRTRVAPPGQAVQAFETVGRQLLVHGVRQLFFKYCATFDSTPAGNIGPCADVLQRLTGAPLIGFCPSFPEVGRRVFQGHLFVDQALVSESPKRYDPLTPMLDPNLVRVLGEQTPVPVGLLPQQILHEGREAAARHCAALRESGRGHVIIDAATPSDLKAVAALTVEWPVMTGNSSIAAYYPELWRNLGWLDEGRAVATLPAVGGGGIVLAGSCAERTLRQLEVFEQHRPVLRLDPTDGDNPDAIVGRALEWIVSRLQDGPVAVATSAGPEEVARAQGALGRDGAARRAESILSGIAVQARQAGVRRFLVAGGETSGAVVEALGVDQLAVGPYRAPGISHAVTPSSDPVAFCLKSGKLGAEDMFLPMLDRLSRGE